MSDDEPIEVVEQRLVRERESSGAMAFQDAVYDYYAEPTEEHRERLLRAADKMIDSVLLIDEDQADTIVDLTGETLHMTSDPKIKTYRDAAHAIQRWLVAMKGLGVRH